MSNQTSMRLIHSFNSFTPFILYDMLVLVFKAPLGVRSVGKKYHKLIDGEAKVLNEES